MAHFAQLDENNIVIQVIVVLNDDTTNDQGQEEEAVGIAYLKGLFGDDTNWKQTSYHHNFRKAFASKGFSYDSSDDTFKPPKPSSEYVWDATNWRWTEPIALETAFPNWVTDSGDYLYSWNGTEWVRTIQEEEFRLANKEANRAKYPDADHAKPSSPAPSS